MAIDEKVPQYERYIITLFTISTATATDRAKCFNIFFRSDRGDIHYGLSELQTITL